MPYRQVAIPLEELAALLALDAVHVFDVSLALWDDPPAVKITLKE